MPHPSGVTVYPHTKKFARHPFCAAVPGEMSDPEVHALMLNIRQYGQLEPITIFNDMILDGWARYRACVNMGKEFATEPFRGPNPKSFVISQNMHRRQLSAMQKGIVGARLHLESAVTQADAAVQVGVSARTVFTAVRLLKSKNTPLINRAVKGEVTTAELDEALYEETHDVASRKSAESKVSVRAPVVHISPVTKALDDFMALGERDRVAFVRTAWNSLVPALEAAGKNLPKSKKAA